MHEFNCNLPSIFSTQVWHSGQMLQCVHANTSVLVIEVLMRFVLRWWVLILLVILEFKRFIKWNYFVSMFGAHSSHCNNSCINHTLHFETSLLRKIWESKLYSSWMKSSGWICMEPRTRQIKIIKACLQPSWTRDFHSSTKAKLF